MCQKVLLFYVLQQVMVSYRKSLRKSDPGKGVNLHIFKMAANETINVLLTVYG